MRDEEAGRHARGRASKSSLTLLVPPLNYIIHTDCLPVSLSHLGSWLQPENRWRKMETDAQTVKREESRETEHSLISAPDTEAETETGTGSRRGRARVTCNTIADTYGMLGEREGEESAEDRILAVHWIAR